MKVRINRDKPSKAQMNVLKKECRKEFDTLIDEFNYQVAMQVLHILHFDYGFGQKRLEQFSDKLAAMQQDQLDRYQMDKGDTPWICEYQLKNDGIDVEALMGGKENE